MNKKDNRIFLNYNNMIKKFKAFQYSLIKLLMNKEKKKKNLKKLNKKEFFYF